MADIFFDGGNAFDTSTGYLNGGGANTGQPATTVTAGVYAPDIATYSTRTPYITAAEFTEAGTGVDTGQLVQGGDVADQAAALTRAIARASSWADTYCRKVLAATLDTDSGRFLVRDGVCSVPLRYSPIIEVVGISAGATAWSLSQVADLTRVAILPPRLVEFGAPGRMSGGRLFVSVTYVNGWTCTRLAERAALGGMSVTLASNLGLYPGSVLTLDDGGETETVTVDATYSPGAAGPVPLAAPLTADHAAGAAFTAIPQDVKQAVILYTAALIKTRGDESFVMPSIGAEPDTLSATQSGGTRDVQLAQELLQPYRRPR